MSELAKMLRQYTDAFARGNFDTMSTVLAFAEHDIELERAIWNWHAEHDDEVVTPEDVAQVRRIVQDACERFERGEL